MEDTYEIRDKKVKGKLLNRTEYTLYVNMVGIGLDPMPQYEISRMTVDFAFPIYRLVVEVNGPNHYNSDGTLKHEDKKRYAQLSKTLGWKIKTFRANKVREYPTFIAEKIKEELELLGWKEEIRQVLNKPVSIKDSEKLDWSYDDDKSGWDKFWAKLKIY